jgi:mRNA-degrading endonuclease RelE of RelBE toxin-antitoxin system
MHPLELGGPAARQLRSLPPATRDRLRAELSKIRGNPTRGKRLRGALSHLRSWRVGTFRILYQYSEGVIRVTNLGHRSAICRHP